MGLRSFRADLEWGAVFDGGAFPVVRFIELSGRDDGYICCRLSWCACSVSSDIQVALGSAVGGAVLPCLFDPHPGDTLDELHTCSASSRGAVLSIRLVFGHCNVPGDFGSMVAGKVCGCEDQQSATETRRCRWGVT